LYFNEQDLRVVAALAIPIPLLNIAIDKKNKQGPRDPKEKNNKLAVAFKNK